MRVLRDSPVMVFRGSLKIVLRGPSRSHRRMSQLSAWLVQVLARQIAKYVLLPLGRVFLEKKEAAMSSPSHKN